MDWKLTIRVYLKYGGGGFEYDIFAASAELVAAKAREHLGAIAANGYRHNDGLTSLEWFPPHWIDKIKIVGQVPTLYPDRPIGT